MITSMTVKRAFVYPLIIIAVWLGLFTNPENTYALERPGITKVTYSYKEGTGKGVFKITATKIKKVRKYEFRIYSGKKLRKKIVSKSRTIRYTSKNRKKYTVKVRGIRSVKQKSSWSPYVRITAEETWRNVKLNGCNLIYYEKEGLNYLGLSCKRWRNADSYLFFYREYTKGKAGAWKQESLCIPKDSSGSTGSYDEPYITSYVALDPHVESCEIKVMAYDKVNHSWKWAVDDSDACQIIRVQRKTV